MKSFSIWLSIALLFVCLQTGFAQIETSMANRKYDANGQQITTPSVSQPQAETTPKSYQQATKAINRVKTQHMVTAEITADTSGNSHKPDFLDKMDEAARKAFEAAFKVEKVEKEAFHIYRDTTIYRYSQAPSVDVPAPVFPKSEITVKFENGQIVPISKLSDTQKKAIVDTLTAPKPLTVAQIMKNIDPDDEIDSLFNNSKTFTYLGENYSIPSKNEVKSYKPRVKKQKQIGQKFTITHINISSNEEYIDLFEDEAKKGELDGVPASITLAQGILESVGGRSKMAKKINNNFGIKCNGGKCRKQGCQHGYFDDDRVGETFRAYPNFEASFADHVRFFLDNERYKGCLECGLNDIPCWLLRLKYAEYATDPNYDRKLGAVIDLYQLTDKPIHYSRSETKQRLAKRLK